MKTSFNAYFNLALSLITSTLLVLSTINAHADEAVSQREVYQLANSCQSIKLSENETILGKQDNQYQFSNSEQNNSKFYMRPSALGIYLLLDQDDNYLSAIDNKLIAEQKLVSEMFLDMPETDYLVTAAEWELHTSTQANQFTLKNIKENSWLTETGLSSEQSKAANIRFVETQGCSVFPESETGATGKVTKTQFENGMVWGYVDAHEHIGANDGFGGKIFHGAAFHKLGIEHALADCEKHHGENGSKDLMSIGYKSGSGNLKFGDLVDNLYGHLIKGDPEHNTDGYPTLSNWSTHEAPTHQSLYYKWIERAYLGGMRLIVNYAESTAVICETYKSLLPGKSITESCNEMLHVDHQIEKMKELEKYVDAQAGGPGKGWLRLVYSPEEARDVIKEGKLAVILGIEIEDPFNCFPEGRDGFEPCTPEMLRERLQLYHDKGIRALFPSHKFVNAFSSGDGNAGILELGDFFNNGQWRDYDDCEKVPGDYFGPHSEGKQRSMFAKLNNIPGMNLLNELLSSDNDSVNQALPIYPEAKTHCQKNGFTPLGFELIEAMMDLGMIIDLGHTPRAALNDVIPVLDENNYPAVNTHGGDQAAMNRINGMSTRGLNDACRDEQGNSGLQKSFQEILAELNPKTGLPRKGLSYDFNGFAGYNRPRFGENTRCKTEQKDPLEYPFTSIGGDIVFEALTTGERTFDYNTDGLANIGLFPDLIEEARRGGASQESIDALFKTAEAYIQIWERAEMISQQRKSSPSSD